MPLTDKQLSKTTGITGRSLRTLATLGVVRPLLVPLNSGGYRRSWPEDAAEKIKPVAALIKNGVAIKVAVKLVQLGFRQIA